MNCAYHPQIEGVAFCVSCGNSLCAPCRREVGGAVYCESCLGDIVRRGMREPPPVGKRPSTEDSAGARAQAGDTGRDEFSSRDRPSRPSPSAGGENAGAAFALGLIPGVGAIYNGEFLKAAVHIVVFGFLVTLADIAGPADAVFSLLAVGFYFYMPFEAYYTSRKRKLMAEGIDLETPIDRFHQQFGEVHNKELWGGVAMLVLGVLFLVDNFDFLPLRDALRYWPVLLIAAGVLLILRHKETKDEKETKKAKEEREVLKRTPNRPPSPTGGGGFEDGEERTKS